MLLGLRLIGWLACVVYATIPAFWLMIHPFAARWRARDRFAGRSPYAVLLPLWMAMWIVVAAATRPLRGLILYRQDWTWMAAFILFCGGLYLYLESAKNFSGRQLAGVPEVHSSTTQQSLVTGGIRSRVRHPVYLAHVCEMLGWSIGTGLAVCWGLTAFAVVTGAVMIQMEDAELERRFGNEYAAYRSHVPAVLPRLRMKHANEVAGPTVNRVAELFQHILDTLPTGCASLTLQSPRGDPGFAVSLVPTNEHSAEFGAMVLENGLYSIFFGRSPTFTDFECPWEIDLPRSAKLELQFDVLAKMCLAVIAGKCEHRFERRGIVGVIYVSETEIYRVWDTGIMSLIRPRRNPYSLKYTPYFKSTESHAQSFSQLSL